MTLLHIQNESQRLTESHTIGARKTESGSTTDTSELSSFSLSELPVEQSGSPTLMQGPYVPLSTSTPVHMPSDNNQYTEATQDELSFRQVILNIPQQSLYPSLAAMGSTPNTALSPSIPLARRVINEIEEHQRTVLNVYLSKYPAQYINCMTSDSEFIAFINHTIQLVLDLTVYPNIWAVI